MAAHLRGLAVIAAVRIRTTLTSDTPHLPELAPLVGRVVEIVVIPQPVVHDRVPAEYPWPSPEVVAAAEAAAVELRDSSEYDWDAWRVGREHDRKVAAEELRKWQQERADEGTP